jgi:tRNA(fMet)-specific endonuclease VapC
MRILLDTNAYSGWKRGHRGVVEIVRNAEHVYLSTIVVGELLFGFHQGTRFRTNLQELKELLERPFASLLPVTFVTADRFGRIALSLRRQGTPIPSNDIWIAAHAMETGADLVSFDAHFEQVSGLVSIHPGAA